MGQLVPVGAALATSPDELKTPKFTIAAVLKPVNKISAARLRFTAARAGSLLVASPTGRHVVKQPWNCLGTRAKGAWFPSCSQDTQ